MSVIPKPQTRHQISTKIRAMLTERHKFNKAKRYGRGSILLNTNELNHNHVNSDVDLLHKFFQRI